MEEERPKVFYEKKKKKRADAIYSRKKFINNVDDVSLGHIVSAWNFNTFPIHNGS